MTFVSDRKILLLGAAAAAVSATCAVVWAQTPPSPAQNPVCSRLEAQLNAIDRGAAEATRVDQLKRLEDAANKQQFDLDRLSQQSQKAGCEGSGFFLFGG